MRGKYRDFGTPIASSMTGLRFASESRAESIHQFGKTEIAMLVLTRKPDEQILIGDQIKLTVVRVRGNQVKIGIEAPREIRVIRGELGDTELDGIQADNRRPPETLRMEQEIEFHDETIEEREEAGFTDRHEVFAHPAPVQKPDYQGKPLSRRVTNRIPSDDAKRRIEMDRGGYANAASAVFMGRIRRGGQSAELTAAEEVTCNEFNVSSVSRLPASATSARTPLGKFVKS